ncbi:MAG: hypothetical protein GTO03_08400 [Planctomycetales bacterium]|nr:hypothetical protein [Planctomycetales bacterium]
MPPFPEGVGEWGGQACCGAAVPAVPPLGAAGGWPFRNRKVWQVVLPDTLVVETDREHSVGTKKTGKGRRKVGRKKRRMRAKIRHRKK